MLLFLIQTVYSKLWIYMFIVKYKNSVIQRSKNVKRKGTVK